MSGSIRLSPVQAIELDLYQDIENAARDLLMSETSDDLGFHARLKLSRAIKEMDRFRKDYP